MRLNRLNDMEEYILQKGTVSLEELANRFAISEITTRRDLSELEKRGVKKFTAVRPPSNRLSPVPSEMRARSFIVKKRRRSAFLPSMVENNETVLLTPVQRQPV